MSYASAVALARRLIAKKGRTDGVQARPTPGAPASPSTPWKPGSPSNPALATNLAVVVLDVALLRSQEGLTPETTAVAHLHAGTDWRAGDILTTRGKTYHVLRAIELAPGDDTVLWTLHLKG